MRLSRKNKGIKRNLKRTRKRGGVSADTKKPKKADKVFKPMKLPPLNLLEAEKVRTQMNRDYNDKKFLKQKEKENEAEAKSNKENETYTPPEVGVEKIDQSPNDTKDAFDRMDDEEHFFDAEEEGLTVGGKTRKKRRRKYFKKLGKRSKNLAKKRRTRKMKTKKRRTRKKKGGSDGDTDDEKTMDKEEFGNALDILDNRRGELKQRRSEIIRARNARSLTEDEERELKSIEDELDKIDREFDNLHKMYDYYDENPNKRRRMRGGNNKKEEILKLCADGIQMIKDIGIDNNEINIIQKMVDDNSSTIDDIIMESINNKKDLQENLWDLILKLKTFIEGKGVQSGGRENQPSKVPTVRTTSGEDPRAPHEIDPHDIPGGIRQVLHWEDLTEEDMKELQNIGANQEEVMDLMAVGMTLEQLYQVVRNVDDSLSNRGIIRRGNHFHQTHSDVTRYPAEYRYIVLAIMMLLISLPRVINVLSVRNHANSGLNLILDMLQLILSLLYLVHRGGYL